MKSENMGGGRIFFLKLRQSLNFPQISKRMAPTCSEEQSPYRKNNKKKIYIYIRGGRGASAALVELNSLWSQLLSSQKFPLQ